jgi:hypothetical protein
MNENFISHATAIFCESVSGKFLQLFQSVLTDLKGFRKPSNDLPILQEGLQHRLSFASTFWTAWLRRIERQHIVSHTLRAPPNLLLATQLAPFGH